jgi:cytochrome c oxidase subunit III
VSDASFPPVLSTLGPDQSGRVKSRPVPPPIVIEKSLGTTRWGMLSFLASEAAFFATLIVAYITFSGKDEVGPTPSEALTLPLVLCTTLCLLSSSVTIHFAERRLRTGDQAQFRLWWTTTIVLGVAFLLGTAYEWNELITRHHLTITRNLFGTTYYTLFGFHGLHVTAGVVIMLTMLGLALGAQVTAHNQLGVEMVSWYWHFVDGVWVVVFTVVYLIRR